MLVRYAGGLRLPVEEKQPLAPLHESCIPNQCRNEEERWTMQCYEFEAMLTFMERKVADYGMARKYDRLELADILLDHDVTRLDQLPDVVSLARNLQAGIRLAA
jgi:hypothetical protein